MDSPNLANPFSLINVPHEILVEIALETALIDVLGPPSHLLALLCTCRRIYNQLARSTDLLGRIFRAKFDVSAIRRRFGPLGLHNKNLASQLKVYCSTMRRIREGDIHSENLEQDLWIAYFMLSENDGRNAIQLREWANIFPFVDRIVRTRLYEDAPQTGWPLENVRNNLAMWILWFVTDIDTLRAEGTESREPFVRLVLPFVIAAFRYPMFYAADVHFELPLMNNRQVLGNLPQSIQTAHGPFPHYPCLSINSRLQTTHFGQRITVALPPISGAAQLLYFARRSLNGLAVPLGLPRDRAHALSLPEPEATGPTVADYNEFNSSPSTRVLAIEEWDSGYNGPTYVNGVQESVEQAIARGESGWRLGLSREQLELDDSGTQKFGLKAPSAMWDCDWERITSCYDPWLSPPTGASKYWVGSLVGDWVGRMIFPEELPYLTMMQDPVLRPFFGETHPYLALRPLNLTIREMHSISPATRLNCGGDSEARRTGRGVDDGVQNGYFPNVHARQTERGVNFTDVVDLEQEFVYESYTPGQRTSHSKETCRFCGDSDGSMDEDDSLGESSGSSSHSGAVVPPEAVELFREAGLDSEPDYNDDEDDDNDSVYFMDQECTGLQDIVFTGTTQKRHGDAWGHYDYYGRMRPWDGLIVLVGIPNDANPDAWGKWVFRGYLHGGTNYSGRWRHAGYDIHSPPYEGPFCMSKRQTAGN